MAVKCDDNRYFIFIVLSHHIALKFQPYLMYLYPQVFNNHAMQKEKKKNANSVV